MAGKPISGPIGYVPQEDALHGALTVRSALRFAAELRLPAMPESSRNARVEAVLVQVGLTERAEVAIKKLSGGQKKRVSVAQELLTSPPILVLDEPTSGLDPGMEAKMMELFAAVAKSGRIVLVTTHAMQSLELCSRLVVLVAGRLAYAGSVAGAPAFFGAASLNDIFGKLTTAPPEGWAAKWRANAVSLGTAAPVLPAPPVELPKDPRLAAVDKKLLEQLAALKQARKG
jgi:ABC-type multidrug transport system ATPase subunit